MEENIYKRVQAEIKKEIELKAREKAIEEREKAIKNKDSKEINNEFNFNFTGVRTRE